MSKDLETKSYLLGVIEHMKSIGRSSMKYYCKIPESIFVELKEKGYKFDTDIVGTVTISWEK